MIIFFNKKTGNLVSNPENYFINNKGEVWRDNQRTYESQSSVVSLETFMERCKDISWFIEQK